MLSVKYTKQGKQNAGPEKHIDVHYQNIEDNLHGDCSKQNSGSTKQSIDPLMEQLRIQVLRSTLNFSRLRDILLSIHQSNSDAEYDTHDQHAEVQVLRSTFNFSKSLSIHQSNKPNPGSTKEIIELPQEKQIYFSIPFKDKKRYRIRYT